MILASKDSTTSTIAEAIRTGRIKVEPAQVKILNELIQQSIEAGYHRSHKSFSREVTVALESAEADARHEASTKKVPAKKN